jgi:hypothetical protein
MRSMIPRGDSNSFWLSTPFDDPIEAVDHPFGWQRKINLDAKPFAVKVVQHVQQPKRPTIHCPAVHVYMHERGRDDPP